MLALLRSVFPDRRNVKTYLVPCDVDRGVAFGSDTPTDPPGELPIVAPPEAITLDGNCSTSKSEPWMHVKHEEVSAFRGRISLSVLA
jgi:hypothetical protein